MMGTIFRLPAIVAATLLTACGFVDYDALPAGVFTGSVLVLWVEENDSTVGDGLFVYVPVPGDELTLTRANPDATLTVIRPGVIYTDGGSVPRVAQPFRGFSPWGYAPAYMVHDWLFVAKKCATDGAATPAEAPVGAMPFRESAEVLGEAIKTLIAQKMVRPNDVAPEAISSAVAGPVVRAIWFQRGKCAENRLRPEHKARVDDYIRRLGTQVRARGVAPERAVSGVRAVGLVRF